jgi:hypothetical protein
MPYRPAPTRAALQPAPYGTTPVAKSIADAVALCLQARMIAIDRLRRVA